MFFSIINLLRLFQTPEIHLKIYLTPLNSLTLINGLELTPLLSLMPLIIFLSLSELKKKLKNPPLKNVDSVDSTSMVSKISKN